MERIQKEAVAGASSERAVVSNRTPAKKLPIPLREFNLREFKAGGRGNERNSASAVKALGRLAQNDGMAECREDGQWHLVREKHGFFREGEPRVAAR